MPQTLDFDTFRAMVAEQLDRDVATITPEKSFTEDLEADSLDVVELVMLLEETYAISIPDDDAEKLGTVGDAWAYLQERMKAPAAP